MHKLAIVAAIVALALAAAASAGGSPPASYTAKVFMKGMTLPLPDAGWTLSQDKAGVLVVNAPHGPLTGGRLVFYLDPYPLAPHGQVAPVRSVGHTAPALINWLHHNPNFVTSAPATRRIAGGLAVPSLDLDVAATAPREDPHCTSACITWLSIINHGSGHRYGFQYGTGHGEPNRLYLATFGSGTASHVLAILIDAPSHAVFKPLTAAAQQILAGTKLPATVSAG